MHRQVHRLGVGLGGIALGGERGLDLLAGRLLERLEPGGIEAAAVGHLDLLDADGDDRLVARIGPVAVGDAGRGEQALGDVAAAVEAARADRVELDRAGRRVGMDLDRLALLRLDQRRVGGRGDAVEARIVGEQARAASRRASPACGRPGRDSQPKKT